MLQHGWSRMHHVGIGPTPHHARIELNNHRHTGQSHSPLEDCLREKHQENCSWKQHEPLRFPIKSTTCFTCLQDTTASSGTVRTIRTTCISFFVVITIFSRPFQAEMHDGSGTLPCSYPIAVRSCSSFSGWSSGIIEALNGERAIDSTIAPSRSRSCSSLLFTCWLSLILNLLILRLHPVRILLRRRCSFFPVV